MKVMVPKTKCFWELFCVCNFSKNWYDFSLCLFFSPGICTFQERLRLQDLSYAIENGIQDLQGGFASACSGVPIFSRPARRRNFLAEGLNSTAGLALFQE
jgi:hypothetical protein